MDSLMTSTVAIDMMTAHTMTATVSNLVRPTGNCKATASFNPLNDAMLGSAEPLCGDEGAYLQMIVCNQLDAHGYITLFQVQRMQPTLESTLLMRHCANANTPCSTAA